MARTRPSIVASAMVAAAVVLQLPSWWAESAPASSDAPPAPVIDTGVIGSGTGSVEYDLDWPLHTAGSTGASIDCAPGPSYSVAFSSISVQNSALAGSVTVRGYDGPGAYDARVELDLGDGRDASLEVPMRLTDHGGSVDLGEVPGAPAATRGRVSWRCG